MMIRPLFWGLQSPGTLLLPVPCSSLARQRARMVNWPVLACDLRPGLTSACCNHVAVKHPRCRTDALRIAGCSGTTVMGNTCSRWHGWVSAQPGGETHSALSHSGRPSTIWASLSLAPLGHCRAQTRSKGDRGAGESTRPSVENQSNVGSNYKALKGKCFPSLPQPQLVTGSQAKKM